MSVESEKLKKRKVMRDLIKRLHQGLPAAEAKEIFEREVGTVSSTEIAEVEQSLISEGIPPEEIMKFCNVHALLFKSSLEASAKKEEPLEHPIHLFRLENREIEKLTKALRDAVKGEWKGPAESVQEIKDLLSRLRGIEVHYTRKEQLLFPYLEKYGFYGPSKVMWGKDDEVRDLLKRAISEVERVISEEGLNQYAREVLDPLLEEVEEMIFKEENILFPTSLEKLSLEDWAEILQESDQIGYAFIEKPKETERLVQELRRAVSLEPAMRESLIVFPTGELRLEEIQAIADTLPVDITFVDKEDQVRYFSQTKDRIFIRTKSVLGRKVQNCHPPQSVDIVEKILASFKQGSRDVYEFWFNYKGRFVHVRYFAVRDREGRYLGTLEVSQDITRIKSLEGEKRLLDERDRP
ncbi:MAG: DUF438 domain-containing protein [Candidatus Bathyarchaeia archaeon]